MPEQGYSPLKPTDEALVDRAVRGDAGAFRDLFERYRARAFRVSYRYLGSHDEALDAVQEAFIKAHRALESFENRSLFRTWFMRIVTNTCLDRRRVRSGEPSGNVEELAEAASEDGRDRSPAEKPGEALEVQELQAALAEAIGELTEAHRTVFVLHAQDGMTYRQIAETLGISEGTVMSRLFHARKNLQKILSNRGVL